MSDKSGPPFCAFLELKSASCFIDYYDLQQEIFGSCFVLKI